MVFRYGFFCTIKSVRIRISVEKILNVEWKPLQKSVSVSDTEYLLNIHERRWTVWRPTDCAQETIFNIVQLFSQSVKDATEVKKAVPIVFTYVILRRVIIVHRRVVVSFRRRFSGVNLNVTTPPPYSKHVHVHPFREICTLRQFHGSIEIGKFFVYSKNPKISQIKKKYTYTFLFVFINVKLVLNFKCYRQKE